MATSSCLSALRRLEFCQRVQEPGPPRPRFGQICREYGISRVTGYAWLRCLRQGGQEGLKARSRRRQGSCEGAKIRRWSAALLALRRQRASWGADKLLTVLKREHPRAKLPSRSAVTRLLERRGLCASRKVRARRGPTLGAPAQRPVQGPNDLWTIDFKGWFRVGDGRRCDPLTVRDLFSRFVLCVHPVAQCNEAAVSQRMRQLFGRYGLPRAIRMDNGAPFGSPTTGAALGLTRLSVGWLRLGIAVEFTRRGCPQDNGAHEQMHRVLKAETARPPARSLAAQSQRMEAWRQDYNERRPHAALGQQCPSQWYKPSARKPRKPEPLRYPVGWAMRVVSAKGTVKWQARTRHVGRAFSGERLGVKDKSQSEGLPAGAGAVWEVYLGGQMLGELHAEDPGGMRAARWVDKAEGWKKRLHLKPAEQAPNCKA